MHSALQETRLLQNFVRSNCRTCCRRCQSPRRSFHCSKNLRGGQGPRNNTASSTQPSNPPRESKNEGNDPDIGSQPSRPALDFISRAPQLDLDQETSPIDASIATPASRFYGSSANRKRRVKASKEQDAPVETEPVPQWFLDHNSRLWGEDEHRLQNARVVKSVKSEGKGLSPDGPGSPSGGAGQSAPGNTVKTERYDAWGIKRKEAVVPPNPDDTQRSRYRYFIESDQEAEILTTAMGLIRAPDSQFRHDPAIRTTHLLLHYAGKDGHFLLDTLARQVAGACTSDLISLDVQDIADMIATSQDSNTRAIDGRLLSYEVLCDRQTSQEVEGEEDPDAEEDDEFDHDQAFDVSSFGKSGGMPSIIMGKPITIDLSKAFRGSPGSASSRSPSMLPHIFGDMFRDGSSKIKQISPPAPPFSAIVNGIIESITMKRQNAPENPHSKRLAEESGLPHPSTVIHIKSLSAIQNTSVGSGFLGQFYEQVERRRANGEHIILLGTDCADPHDVEYGKSRIEDLQTCKENELARKIVITPVLPDSQSKLALTADRQRRIAMINLRHLWETMRLRSNRDCLGLEPGFWAKDTYEKLQKSDRDLLGQSVWPFSRVHRMAVYLNGLSNYLPAEVLLENGGFMQPNLFAAHEALRNSDRTKLKWSQEQTVESKPNIPESKEDARLAKTRASANKHEKRLMSGVVEAAKIKTTFNDVHAPLETIDALQTLTTLSLVRPEAFTYGVLASDKIPGLLLYGPPGTGKTLLAKAVAKESGATMLEASAADLNDMYVGEGEKNVKALFSLAKKLSPCVVFLDEADAMFSARSNAGRRVSHRELLNQFLKEWDGMSNDSGSAFIMVATNRPMDLDDAVLRRLPRRLLVDLPTEKDRHEILKIHLRNEILDNSVDTASLAKRTPLYSGSDLKNLCVAAALNAVREENETAKKHKESSPDTEYTYPERRTLRTEHFDKALEEITASISEDMSSLREIKKFDDQYGDKKGRKRKAPKWGFKSASEADKVLDTAKVRS